MVKPDFEGTIHAANGGFLRSFAVEVMGYDRPEYHAAKARLRAAITGKRVHFLEHLAHDPAGMEEHDRAFRSSLTKLGRRAISKARGMPTLPAAPIRPDQPQAVPRAFMKTASVLASAGHPTSTPGQPGPARAAEASPPGRAYPRIIVAREPPGLPQPDPGPVAGPGHSGLAQRLSRRLRLRR